VIDAMKAAAKDLVLFCKFGAFHFGLIINDPKI